MRKMLVCLLIVMMLLTGCNTKKEESKVKDNTNTKEEKKEEPKEEELVLEEDENKNYLYVLTRKESDSFSDTLFRIGEKVISETKTYENGEAAAKALGHPFFIRQTIEDDTIKEMYLGYILNGKTYYIKGGTTTDYEYNKKVMKAAFGEENCGFGEEIICKKDGVEAFAYNMGFVQIYNDNSLCVIERESNKGMAYCKSW
jgi:protein involved in sex pheromone biosynthesis